jgi:hypothetical protein
LMNTDSKAVIHCHSFFGQQSALGFRAKGPRAHRPLVLKRDGYGTRFHSQTRQLETSGCVSRIFDTNAIRIRDV